MMSQLVYNRRYRQLMDKQKLESKLKSLSHKNKKLLESISTHLINNPDELESKLHEHRYLEHKYNELIGFSRENVERYEKVQATLLLKDEEIKRLSRMLAEAKDSSTGKHDNMEREYRKRKSKDQEEIESLRHEKNVLKKQLASLEEEFKKQRTRLGEELQTSKKASAERCFENEKLEQRVKELEKVQSELKKSHEKQLEEWALKVKSLEQENGKLRQKRNNDSVNEIRATFNSFKNRNRDEDLEQVEQNTKQDNRLRSKKIKEILEMD